jgi:hypothetical protein
MRCLKAQLFIVRYFPLAFTTSTPGQMAPLGAPTFPSLVTAAKTVEEKGALRRAAPTESSDRTHGHQIQNSRQMKHGHQTQNGYQTKQVVGLVGLKAAEEGGGLKPDARVLTDDSGHCPNGEIDWP